MHFRSSSILQMSVAGPVSHHHHFRGGADPNDNDNDDARWSRCDGRCCCCYFAEPPAPPAPLTTPAVTGPLQWLPPAMFDAGPLGKIAANGIVTGFGMVQSNHVPGDDNAQAALSNGQIFIQKADGKFQYFIQAGAYTLPSLATAFLPADKTVSNFYGALPVAFAKVQAGKTTQFLIGSLPTLIGAEYTFTFQNMNIERGLLWNQEPAISRGIQVNQALGKCESAHSVGTTATIPTATRGSAALCPLPRDLMPWHLSPAATSVRPLIKPQPHHCRTTAASTT